MVFEMGSRWLYSHCIVGCCFLDLLNIAHRILVQLPSSFFSICLISVQVVHLCYGMNAQPLLGKSCYILSYRSDFHMTDSLSIADHAFTSRKLMSFSVDETLLPRWVNLFTSFWEPPFSVEISPLWLKHIYSILSAFTWRPMLPVACSRLCSGDSALAGVFAQSAMSSA